MTGILPDSIGLAYGGPVAVGPQVLRVEQPAGLAQPSDNPLVQILEEKAAALAAQARADEFSQREQLLSDAVDHALQHELHALCTLPDEATLQAHKQKMSEFAKWSAGRGLRLLPARASSVAAFLVDSGFTSAQASSYADAIRFTHDMAGFWLDDTVIRAALMFIKKADTDADIVAEAADDLKLPSTNGGAHEQH